MYSDMKQVSDIYKILFTTGALKPSRFLLLIVLVVISSILDMAGVGLVIPVLLSILGEDGGVIDFQGISSGILVFLFIAFTLFSGVFRIIALYYQTLFGFKSGVFVGVKCYGAFLNLPYEIISQGQSSDHVNKLNSKILFFIEHSCIPIITLVSSTIMLIFIGMFLITINPSLTIILGLVPVLFYLIMSNLMKNRLTQNSMTVSDSLKNIASVTTESFANIKQVKITSLTKYFLNSYDKSFQNYALAQTHNSVIGIIPRYLLEAISIVIIILYVFAESKSQDVSFVLAEVAAIALGFQRLMPVVQGIYASWTKIKTGEAVANELAGVLQESNSTEDDNHIIVQPKSVSANNISCVVTINNYSKEIFNNINFNIYKGEVIRIKGKSGSGKSTLLEILLGLRNPSGGEVIIGDMKLTESALRGWWKNISYLEQNITLYDGSVLQNIIGVSESSNLDEAPLVIEIIKDVWHINTNEAKIILRRSVGEGGGLLSGGERQRVGIARALYERKPFIFLDEATSALDKESESYILEILKKYASINHVAIIMISHSQINDDFFDKIINIGSSQC